MLNQVLMAVKLFSDETMHTLGSILLLGGIIAVILVGSWLIIRAIAKKRKSEQPEKIDKFQD